MKTRIATAIALLLMVMLAIYFYNPFILISVIFTICIILNLEWQFFPIRIPNSNVKNINISKIKGYTHKTYTFFVATLAYVCISTALIVLLIKSNNLIGILFFVPSIAILWLISATYSLRAHIGTFSKNKIFFLYNILPLITNVGLILSFIFLLLIFNDTRISILVFILPLIWITDSAAYFIGKLFGKRKLANNISPNKTIEGAVAGVFCSTLLISIIYSFIYPKDSIGIYLFFLILAILSVVGDLFQSRLKREFNIKDSGNILPGHGGLFDRLDGAIPVILFAIFIVFFVPNNYIEFNNSINNLFIQAPHLIQSIIKIIN